MARGLGNLEANFALFERLPDAAREQLREDLTAIGQFALKLQESLVARRTGRLASTLDIQVALGVLRVRVGMLRATINGKATKQTSGSIDQFYGFIVEGGRKAGAQTVMRRTKSGKLMPMNAVWTALRARHFVHVEYGIEGQVDALRERFWGTVLAKVDAA